VPLIFGGWLQLDYSLCMNAVQAIFSL
jgi:hypothetical protein